MIKAHFWDKVRDSITTEMLDVVRKAENTAESKNAARRQFCDHPSIHNLFWGQQKAQVSLSLALTHLLTHSLTHSLTLTHSLRLSALRRRRR